MKAESTYQGVAGTLFGVLLQSHLNARGMSRNAFAKAVGCDPSYLTRICHGDRMPPSRALVDSMARNLRLDRQQSNQFFVLAGFCPPALHEAWDDSIQAVTDVLNDVHLSPEERDEFRSVVRLISARWRGGAELSSRFAS